MRKKTNSWEIKSLTVWYMNLQVYLSKWHTHSCLSISNATRWYYFLWSSYRGPLGTCELVPETQNILLLRNNSTLQESFNLRNLHIKRKEIRTSRQNLTTFDQKSCQPFLRMVYTYCLFYIHFWEFSLRTFNWSSMAQKQSSKKRCMLSKFMMHKT